VIGNDQIGATDGQNSELQAESGYTYVDESETKREKVEYYSSANPTNDKVEDRIYVNDEVSATQCDQNSYEAINPKHIERVQSHIYEGFEEPKKKRPSRKASGKSNTSGHSYLQYDDGAHPEGIEEENLYDVCESQMEREEDVYDTLQD
jgi:hypothetical protein